MGWMLRNDDRMIFYKNVLWQRRAGVMEWKDGKRRCRWANPKNEAYIEYHDKEWGVPSYDDRYLFEMLVLESFQAGLSWECVLNKREAFR